MLRFLMAGVDKAKVAKRRRSRRPRRRTTAGRTRRWYSYPPSPFCSPPPGPHPPRPARPAPHCPAQPPLQTHKLDWPCHSARLKAVDKVVRGDAGMPQQFTVLWQYNAKAERLVICSDWLRCRSRGGGGGCLQIPGRDEGQPPCRAR